RRHRLGFDAGTTGGDEGQQRDERATPPAQSEHPGAPRHGTDGLYVLLPTAGVVSRPHCHCGGSAYVTREGSSAPAPWLRQSSIASERRSTISPTASAVGVNRLQKRAISRATARRRKCDAARRDRAPRV